MTYNNSTKQAVGKVCIDNNASYTWKVMLKTREHCKNLFNKSIANGQNTYLWFDPWIQGNNLISMLGWQHMSDWGNPDSKVAEIIYDGRWNLADLHIPNHTAEKIKQIKISDNNNKDFWVWTGNANGKFSIGSAYKVLSPHNSILDWAKFIWSKPVVQKYAFTTYLACFNKLPTMDRIHKWCQQSSQVCKLCNSFLEDRNHLFFICPYSKFIWNYVKSKLKINTNASYNLLTEISNLLTLKSGDCDLSDIARIAVTTVVHQIWKERCRRVFNNNKIAQEIKAELIYAEIEAIFRAFKSKKKMMFTREFKLDGLENKSVLPSISCFEPP